ncbi:matrilin-3a isoform X1 [Sebastes fasciatus]|uniref:matrilin-3a isoform X1 n=1 Tax=Sebastes fasciatus TaxID=394691 RepID=UPI003D9E0677
MKSVLWSVLSCVSLLLADVLATYHHLSETAPQLLAAQSFAQTRTNGRPPFRTLNPAIHSSDYTYRGGYHYHYQPPWIPPPVLYRPLPLSPPLTYHRPSAPVPPYHHRVKGPHMHHIYKGLSPPVAHHPHHRLKGPFPHTLKGPCPTKSDPTVPTVVHLPTAPPALPEPAVLPTLPATTVAPVTPVLPVLPVVVTAEPPVETSAPVTLPVSTQSGSITSVSPVETGLDPCAMGNDCEHVCVNSNASFYCQCRDAYILNADKKTCSLKQVKAVVVVEDPCKCEARLAFQKQTQAAIQLLTAKLADVSGRMERLENTVGRV